MEYCQFSIFIIYENVRFFLSLEKYTVYRLNGSCIYLQLSLDILLQRYFYFIVEVFDLFNKEKRCIFELFNKRQCPTKLLTRYLSLECHLFKSLDTQISNCYDYYIKRLHNNFYSINVRITTLNDSYFSPINYQIV